MMTTLATTFGWLFVLVAVAAGQEAPVPGFANKNASDVVQGLIGFVSIGMLFPGTGPDAAEKESTALKLIEGLGLQPTSRDTVKELGFGGVWFGKNETGSVMLRVFSPWLIDKNTDKADVAFVPPTEQPTPAPILTAMLAKSEKTDIKGDRTEVVMPMEKSANSRCYSQREITLRTATGAIIVNNVAFYCRR